MPFTRSSAMPPPVEPPELVPVPVQTLPLRFAGSGREYFRIWIVDLLLTVVSLSLYWPFARVRRITWFHNNTLIGEEPLGFHGDPWRMLRSHLAMLLLLVPALLLSGTDPALAGLMTLALVLAWPALWHASLTYRLRNTSWRGVPMAFVGDLQGAYAALLPLLLPWLMLGLLLLRWPFSAHWQTLTSSLANAALWPIAAAGVLLAPWGLARREQYRHGHCVFAGECSCLRVGLAAFYAEALRGAVLLTLMGLMLLCAALVVGIGWGHVLAERFDDKLPRLAVWFILPVLCGLLVPLVLLPYSRTRLHNLMWSNTRSRHTRFRSELSVGAMVRLHAINWLLIGLTLGLYWPFAQVRMARARMDGMSLQIRGDVDRWLYGPRARIRR